MQALSPTGSGRSKKKNDIMKKNNRTLKILLLISLSLLTILLLAEFTLRMYSYIEPGLNSKIYEKTYFHPILHPYLGHNDFSPYVVTPVKKANPEKFIILLLGGSTAQGAGASDLDRIISRQLENYLNEKNPFPGISDFYVVNNAHHGYHTTQDRVMLTEHIINGSQIDMVISIDGFNNLVRPLENSAYGLPLNYPGWYWIAYNRLLDKDRYFSLVRYFFDIRKRNGLFKYKLIDTAGAQIFNDKAKKFRDRCFEEIISKVSSMSEEEQVSVMDRASDFYRKDILFMDKLARSYNIMPVFILQPLLGLDRKEQSGFEKELIEKRNMFDFMQAPYSVWVNGQRKLQSVGALIRDEGVEFLDYTPIFRDLDDNPYADLMHMNDLGQRIFADKLSDYIIDRLKKDLK